MAALFPRPFLRAFIDFDRFKRLRANQVQPRSRNKINKMGIGTPISHKKIQPAFPASPALSHVIFIAAKSRERGGLATGEAHEHQQGAKLKPKFSCPEGAKKLIPETPFGAQS